MAVSPKIFGRVVWPYFKRLLDIVGAVFGLVAAGPVILLSALLVWLEDPSIAPFIRQKRLGVGEVSFDLVKLRTMRAEREREGRKLSDAERLLRCGRWFRKLSIDELPQLVNVFRGDMSFIGPRPMPVVYQPYFRPEERLRHTVRPGMSGLAQVRGRNFLSWDQKFALDVEYVRQFGPMMDVRIFFLTLLKLAIPSGVGTRGEDLPVQSLHEIREPSVADEHAGSPKS